LIADVFGRWQMASERQKVIEIWMEALHGAESGLGIVISIVKMLWTGLETDHDYYRVLGSGRLGRMSRLHDEQAAHDKENVFEVVVISST
jgi:hypothetical protein